MKTLYLHIGTMKTGTTAIQKFLFHNNKKFLEENNFCYPKFPIKFKNVSIIRNGLFLNEDKIIEGNRICNIENEDVEKCIKMIIDAFKTFDNVIISNETLYYTLGKKYQDRIEKLLYELEKNNILIKVIVYFRRQDEFMESYWNQSIKRAGNKQTLDEFISSRGADGRLYYYERVQELAYIFGKENIIVRRFQKQDLIGENAVEDFLSILNLAPVDVEKREKPNERLSNNMLFIKKEINTYSKSSRNWGREIEAVLRLADEKPSINEYKSTFIPKDKAVSFMSQYELGNNKLAKEYINDGKGMFDLEYSDLPEWNINNSAMLEDTIKAVAVITGVLSAQLEEQNKRINELERHNNRWKNALRHPIQTLQRKVTKNITSNHRS